MDIKIRTMRKLGVTKKDGKILTEQYTKGQNPKRNYKKKSKIKDIIKNIIHERVIGWPYLKTK